jgi:hypothetical protein
MKNKIIKKKKERKPRHLGVQTSTTGLGRQKDWGQVTKACMVNGANHG